MGQRSAEPVELPDDQAIAGLHKRECLGQSHASGAGAANTILEQMSFVDPAGEERVSLQVQGLAITVGGDAHIADQHVRKTPLVRFPHSAPFRQGLSIMFWREINAGIGVDPRVTEIRCFPSPSKRHRHQSKNRNSLILRRANLNPFHFRPLMRTRTPFRYGQSVDAQVKHLRAAGAEKIFRETASGAQPTARSCAARSAPLAKATRCGDAP